MQIALPAHAEWPGSAAPMIAPKSPYRIGAGMYNALRASHPGPENEAELGATRYPRPAHCVTQVTEPASLP